MTPLRLCMRWSLFILVAKEFRIGFTILICFRLLAAATGGWKWILWCHKVYPNESEIAYRISCWRPSSFSCAPIHPAPNVVPRKKPVDEWESVGGRCQMQHYHAYRARVRFMCLAVSVLQRKRARAAPHTHHSAVTLCGEQCGNPNINYKIHFGE